MAMEDLIDNPGRFIIDPDRRYTEWGIWEIYTGPNGTGAYVPNVDDAVRDWGVGFFRVATVDYTTGLSVLVPWDAFSSSESVQTEDVLLGVGPGYQSESWRVYLDTRKMPHVLEVDRRLHLYGTEVHHYKVFKGSDISESGTVISAFYDQNGNFLGENIPFELVRTPDANNLAIKAPMTGYTGYKLSDGESVTVVAYNNNGTKVGHYKMLVDNTSLVRRTDAFRKYVKAIRLETPFLSKSDPTLIEFPINVNAATVSMQGVVEYSDGTLKRIPITEGTGNFQVFGLAHYVPTIQGQIVPLTLNYRMGEDEYSYTQGPTYNESITERYRAKTIAADNVYSIKLYAYPVWQDDIRGYTLDFWLFNLDRQEYYRVPKGMVQVNSGSRNFDGLDFLTSQRVTFALSMNELDGKYTTYRHIQTVEIALKAPGNEDRTNWLIKFTPGGLKEYGMGLKAAVTFINTNNWTIDISNGFNSKEEWLRHTYEAVEPLFDDQVEVEAPEPTHFIVHTARRQVEFTIDQWNQPLGLYYDLNEGEVLFIRFIRRTVVNDLQLAVIGLPCHQV